MPKVVFGNSVAFRGSDAKRSVVPTTTFLSFTAAREFAAAQQVVRFFGCC
jgi:hypothetical protein